MGFYKLTGVEMKVSNEIDIYEINREETIALDKPKVKISSHWIHKDRVVLEFGDNNITVLAADFKRAIDNACNHKSGF